MNSTNGIVSYVENLQNHNLYWEKGTLFTTLNTTIIRNILTTTFVVLNFFIVRAGAFFLKKRNLYTLRKKRKAVPMNRLTSWISPIDTVIYAWHTLQLPGGFCGLLMFATGTLGLANQYFVNLFIVPVFLQSNCTFERGVVTTSDKVGAIPSSTLSAAHTVYNAQYQALLNGGEWGIYEKVNYTCPTFKPTTQDVIGGWNCSYQPDTIIARTDWQNQSLLESFLQKQNFLFAGVPYNISKETRNDDSVKGFLAWNAKQQNHSTVPWIVRASVSVNLQGAAAATDSTAPVINLECLLKAKAGRTLPEVPISASLKKWADKTFGFLMSDPSSSYKLDIEWMLNAIVMVSGTANIDTRVLPAGATTAYGCMVRGTKIMLEIWAILGALLLVFVPLVLVDIVLRLSQHFQREHGANLVEAGPSRVDQWQLALLREITGEPKIKARQMRDYSYGWDIAKGKYVLNENTAFQRRGSSDAAINPTTSDSK